MGKPGRLDYKPRKAGTLEGLVGDRVDSPTVWREVIPLTPRLPALASRRPVLSHMCVVTVGGPANLLPFTWSFPPGCLYSSLRSSQGLAALSCSPGSRQTEPHEAIGHPSCRPTRSDSSVCPLPGHGRP